MIERRLIAQIYSFNSIEIRHGAETERETVKQVVASAINSLLIFRKRVVVPVEDLKEW
jgi:hypothetical protein